MCPTWFIGPSFNYLSWGREWQLLDMRDKLVASLLPAWPLLTLCSLLSNISWADQHYLTRFCQPGCSSPLLLSHYLGNVETLHCYLYQISGPVSAWRALVTWSAPVVTPANEDARQARGVMRLTLSVTLGSGGEWSPHHVTRCRNVTRLWLTFVTQYPAWLEVCVATSFSSFVISAIGPYSYLGSKVIFLYFPA